MSFAEERRYTTSTLCAVAGCDPATFRAWRNRNGLFPETRVEGTNKRPWNLFSVVDMCVARTVRQLVGMGLNASSAVHVAQDFGRDDFIRRIRGEVLPSLAFVYRGGADGQHLEVVRAFEGDLLGDVMEKLGNGKEGGIALNTLAILEHVVFTLGELDAETVATENEAKGFILSALAEGLRPDDDPEDESG